MKKQPCFDDNEPLWAKHALSKSWRQVIHDNFQAALVRRNKEQSHFFAKRDATKWWNPPVFKSSLAARHHLITALGRVFLKKCAYQQH